MLPILPLTAQNRSSEMASLKRSRTLPTDGHVAHFLYTIIKQLDLKNVSFAIFQLSGLRTDRTTGRLERCGLRTGHFQWPRCPDEILALQEPD